MAGPLKDIRILDLTRVLAGPWCTQILADLGAEVIKIERPGMGDDTRHWGPPWLVDADGNETAESGYFLSTNRGKHSVTVDISTAKGQEIIRALAAKSDVVIENFKVGGLRKQGLDHQSLCAIDPSLIYVSITGFGQTGPLAAQPGYDYLVQARGGLMSVTGVPDEMPGAGPQRVGVAIGDITTGLYAAIAILAALNHRTATGQGQYIDLSLLDTQVGWLANQALNYFLSGVAPTRTGEWHPNLAPYQPFPTMDEPVIIAVGNNNQFAKLCRFIGRGELAADEKFATNPARVKNRAALIPLLSEEIAKKPSAYWLQHLPTQGVPACPVNTIDKVFDEPQIKHRGIKIELDHTSGVKTPGLANPIQFSKTKIDYNKAPPMLGEDTDFVLAKVLDLTPAEIARLHDDGVL